MRSSPNRSTATVATIAGCFGVPISFVDSSKQPPYANSEATQLQYQAQCLQAHLTGIETALDEGLELPAPYGTEFDIDELIWMDTATRTKAAHDAIAAGAMTPNEARFKYFGLGPVPGGDYAVPATADVLAGGAGRARCGRSVRQAGARPTGARGAAGEPDRRRRRRHRRRPRGES